MKEDRGLPFHEGRPFIMPRREKNEKNARNGVLK